MTKTSRQNLNILKQKAFFIIFKGLQTAKNCLRPASAPLNNEAIVDILIVFKVLCFIFIV